MDFIRIGQCKLRLVISELGRGWYSKLRQGGAKLLQHIGPDLRLLVTTLYSDNFQNSGGQGEIINPPASSESSSNNLWIRNQIHSCKVTHSFSDLPTVNIRSVEIVNVMRVEIFVALRFGRNFPCLDRGDTSSCLSQGNLLVYSPDSLGLDGGLAHVRHPGDGPHHPKHDQSK